MFYNLHLEVKTPCVFFWWKSNIAVGCVRCVENWHQTFFAPSILGRAPHCAWSDPKIQANKSKKHTWDLLHSLTNFHQGFILVIFKCIFIPKLQGKGCRIFHHFSTTYDIFITASICLLSLSLYNNPLQPRLDSFQRTRLSFQWYFALEPNAKT